MTSKSFIIMGEAPESESEEEIDSTKGVFTITPKSGKSKGKVIDGEAPESDEETLEDTGSLESVSSALSVSSIPSLSGEKKTSPVQHSKKGQSLLTKKLCERNSSLAKNMHELTCQTTSIAGHELQATNQQLVKCQVQLQEAVNVLQGLNVSVWQLDAKLECLLGTQYLPLILRPTQHPP